MPTNNPYAKMEVGPNILHGHSLFLLLCNTPQPPYNTVHYKTVLGTRGYNMTWCWFPTGHLSLLFLCYCQYNTV